jgi:hypothetical protein
MIPEVHVKLVIRDEAITLKLLDRLYALGATDCWTKSQKIKPLLSYANNGCRFSSEPEASYYADEVAINFLKELISSKPDMFKLIREYNLRPMLEAIRKTQTYVIMFTLFEDISH